MATAPTLPLAKPLTSYVWDPIASVRVVHGEDGGRLSTVLERDLGHAAGLAYGLTGYLSASFGTQPTLAMATRAAFHVIGHVSSLYLGLGPDWP